MFFNVLTFFSGSECNYLQTLQTLHNQQHSLQYTIDQIVQICLYNHARPVPKIQDNIARTSPITVERQTCEGVLIDTSESKMSRRHFVIEDELSTGFFKLSISGYVYPGGGEWTLTCICHYNVLRSSCSKRRRVFGFIRMSSLREVFVSWLRAGAMEQAIGSIMTGIRAFSAHLPLTSLLWSSTCCFSALRLVSGECLCLVLSVLCWRYLRRWTSLSRLTQTLCIYPYH